VEIGAERGKKAGGDDVSLDRWIDCHERREECEQNRSQQHRQAESRA
jgi:hypothetical protein